MSRYEVAISSKQRYVAEVTSKQRYTAVLLNWTKTAFSFKSYSDVSTSYSIGYTGNDDPIWTDGTNELTGTNVTFTWTNNVVKMVYVYVKRPELVMANFWTDDTIFELNISTIPTLQTTITLSNPSLRRFYTPINSGITKIESSLGIEVIEVLNLYASTLIDVDISLWRAFNLQQFIQPSSEWSSIDFQIDNSIIFGTLNLDNLTIKGGFNLISNPFIEGLTLNNTADWSLCTYFRLENSPLIKKIDVSECEGVLTNAGSRFRIKNIGSTQEDMDQMMVDFSTIIPNNGNSGRILDLLGGSPMSSIGESAKVLIESYGVTVNV